MQQCALTSTVPLNICSEYCSPCPNASMLTMQNMPMTAPFDALFATNVLPSTYVVSCMDKAGMDTARTHHGHVKHEYMIYHTLNNHAVNAT